MLKRVYVNEVEKQRRFMKSAMTIDGVFLSCQDILKWIKCRSDSVTVNIEIVNLSEMKDWYLDEAAGRVRHSTGKFFSIDGIEVNTTIGEKRNWRQPIINQPEVGFLGCLVKEFDGVLYFLVQAKIEPGNLNHVQLSPSLQATKSNYTRQHKGKSPRYLEYFQGARPITVLIDQLQSEQGARFLNKRNRNIIVEIQDDIELDDNFKWLTLGQIKELATYDNIVNMDLRTVISGITFENIDISPSWVSGEKSHLELTKSGKIAQFVLADEHAFHSMDEIISWLTELKSMHELSVEKVSLSSLTDWELSEKGIFHKDRLYFDVRWVSVEIENREVSKWYQPLVKPRQEGLIAFIVKKIDGVYHFLVQAKIECGNFDIFEFAPTVQCITGSYKSSLDRLPYLKYVLSARPDQVKYSALLSEEGGRFYHEQNLNLIIEADSDFPMETPPTYKWLTLRQLLFFIKFNNYVNIQARSLISGIPFL
tara:strand:+ start:21206 stop:22642 length:1437 start_codon:yes stop_codon:yes gene_type:complete